MSISGLYLEQQISLEASGAASMHAVRAIAAQAYGAPGKVKAAFAAESSSAGTIVAKAKAARRTSFFVVCRCVC